MNDGISREVAKLAETIRQEQGVRVIYGRTNGRDCLHLVKNERMDKPVRLSFTIYSQAEWDHHPWNSAARKKDKQENTEVLAAVANRGAI